MHEIHCNFFHCNNKRHSPLGNVNVILCETCKLTLGYGLCETIKKKSCNQMLTYDGIKHSQCVDCEAIKNPFKETIYTI